MEGDLERILFTPEQIRARIRALAGEIAAVYADRAEALTLLPVLAGSLIFTADLIRELPLKMKIALVQLSAYPGTATTAQDPEVVMAVTGEVAGRDVLIVDDILDSGKTLRRVQGLVAELSPASLRTAVLLRKRGRQPEAEADFVGFDVEDAFVVGYGLDYDDHYRNLPCIGVLAKEHMQ
jgi:hypoxanthine phosphoribosyltransferase